MNRTELDRALRSLRLGAMADALEPRLIEAQTDNLAPMDFLSRLVSDELLLGPPGTGKSHLAQALGMNAIMQGFRVIYRETHIVLEEIADAQLDGNRKDKMAELTTIPLLIIDDLGMRKLPTNAAEELLEIVMRRHERTSTIITSNRPVEDWGKLLGDTAAVSVVLDRLLHHGHVITCGPKSYRTSRRSLATTKVAS